MNAQDYRYASNNEIEVRVPLMHDGGQIHYRILDEGEKAWRGTPFMRIDARIPEDAIACVAEWLDERQ